MISLPASSTFLAFAAIFVAAAVIYGLRDVRRFSSTRIGAIAGVCFSDALRRRVLWVTPVAMAATVIISLLGRPVDVLEAVSLTLQAATFSSGMVLVTVTMLLAATNLPREIENRVIFTVATKPTTRLEIVAGKLVGIAGVSAVILLILGAFTFAFVHLQAMALNREVQRDLQGGDLDPATRNRLEHHAQYGLLNSRSLSAPEAFQFTATRPGPDDEIKWITSGEMRVDVAFIVDPQDLAPRGIGGAQAGAAGIVLETQVAVQRRADTTSGDPEQPAMLRYDIFDDYGRGLIEADAIEGGKLIQLPAQDGMQVARAYIEPHVALNLEATNGRFTVRISSANDAYLLGFGSNPTTLLVPVSNESAELDVLTPPPAEFRGRLGNFGQYLPGPDFGDDPTLLYRFRDVTVPQNDSTVPMEMTVGIERGGMTDEGGDATTIEIMARSADGSRTSEPILLLPESNRTVYFDLPLEVLSDGNFDVLIRNRSRGHYVGFVRDGLQAVAAQRPFVLNLLAANLLLWMLSIVVTAIALFCSTFVSWPIAVVLTLMAVTGRFVVERIEPDANFGRQVGEQLFSDDYTRVNVVSRTVDVLNAALNTVAGVLPNLSAFGRSALLEAGLVISLGDLLSALLVVLAWALPLTAAAYVILRNKEVAE